MQPLVRALLYIDEFDCTPEQISSVLGLEASRAWIAGDKIGESPRVRTSNGWVLESRLDEEPDPQRHVAWLLERLPSTFEGLRKVASRWDAQLSLVLEISDATPPFNLPAPLLAQLVTLGASLDIDIILIE